MPQQVDRTDYYAAAAAILSTSGARGLTMTALHRHLGVSSGSFYNWFGNWADFVGHFLAHWAEQTEEIARAAAAPLDPLARLELLRRLARTVPHDVEAAIRVWSTSDPAVATAQAEVDRRRRELVRAAVVEAGAAEHADDLTELCVSMIVGVQLLHRPVDVDALDRLLGRFVALVGAEGRTSGPS